MFTIEEIVKEREREKEVDILKLNRDIRFFHTQLPASISRAISPKLSAKAQLTWENKAVEYTRKLVHSLREWQGWTEKWNMKTKN